MAAVVQSATGNAARALAVWVLTSLAEAAVRRLQRHLGNGGQCCQRLARVPRNAGRRPELARPCGCSAEPGDLPAARSLRAGALQPHALGASARNRLGPDGIADVGRRFG
jgi:hypothetical protein